MIWSSEKYLKRWIWLQKENELRDNECNKLSKND